MFSSRPNLVRGMFGSVESLRWDFFIDERFPFEDIVAFLYASSVDFDSKS